MQPAGQQGTVPRRPSQFPDYRTNVGLKYVHRGYSLVCQHAPKVLLAPLAGFLMLELANLVRTGDLERLWSVASATDLTFNLVTVIACSSVLLAALLAFWLLQVQPVYLVDYAVARPPDSWRWSRSYHTTMTNACQKFSPENVAFQEKIIARSGLGDDTYLPPGLSRLPPDVTMENARLEFEQVCFAAIKDVLDKSGVAPREIGVVIVNCSLFNPTPSLSATIMNHFRMHSNVINYNLGGMGCSAGIIAIDLARQMLQLYPNTYALVVSTENITQNWYFGNQRSMLIPNCIFRVGGAAILLSNKRKDSWRAKYTLQHVVRTNLAANDAAFQCVYENEDDTGTRGVRLSKELMAVAGESLKTNITTLGPLVLPISEQLLFGLNLVARKLLGKKKLKPYIPDFNLAFKHVCIHTGGRAVIDEITKQLNMPKATAEPSRATLYRYGNVSSSSIWYVLAYIESMRGVKRGDTVWQLGFGSGFKCNSAVWKANRRIKDMHSAWEGFDAQQMEADLAQLPS